MRTTNRCRYRLIQVRYGMWYKMWYGLTIRNLYVLIRIKSYRTACVEAALWAKIRTYSVKIFDRFLQKISKSRDEINYGYNQALAKIVSKIGWYLAQNINKYQKSVIKYINFDTKSVSKSDYKIRLGEKKLSQFRAYNWLKIGLAGKRRILHDVRFSSNTREIEFLDKFGTTSIYWLIRNICESSVGFI